MITIMLILILILIVLVILILILNFISTCTSTSTSIRISSKQEQEVDVACSIQHSVCRSTNTNSRRTTCYMLHVQIGSNRMYGQTIYKYGARCRVRVDKTCYNNSMQLFLLLRLRFTCMSMSMSMSTFVICLMQYRAIK